MILVGSCFLTGAHALERRFHAFEDFHIFRKRGFTFMKIVLSSYYLGLTLLRRGFTILEKGIHIYKK